ncbi:hypothetical protein DQ04_02201050 [Trypanosoma grayi]|uniref:hypothetical protein n=1 Tax=Trypanosoma grayi TaxID=71804 RepID=UPI0004F3F0BD|nr:hypothetical protein DQ04_02201050 [Trypanosoma grayi]KEG11865.1 hypothetical protein DQ04_02201050 [Trypanosoma grayi]
MPSLSTSYNQRLQRLFMHFKKNTNSLLEGCCALIELIDEDDLTNWYVLLRYEDENKAEFFVSLRVFFLEELQRMPLVFVIAPRLVATFIHHGAICSLELMSQHWSVDVDGLTLLFRSLHATLNPFGHDSKVTVDELNSNRNNGNPPHRSLVNDASDNPAAGVATVSAYTRDEHDLGIRHIRQSHPHLFRGYTVKKDKCQEHQELDVPPTVVTDGSESSVAFFTSMCMDKEASKKAGEQKVVVHSREELQRLFVSGGEMEVQLDIQYALSSPPTTFVDVDDNIVKCTLPSAGDGTSLYAISLGPYKAADDSEAKTAQEVKNSTTNIEQSSRTEKEETLNNTKGAVLSVASEAGRDASDNETTSIQSPSAPLFSSSKAYRDHGPKKRMAGLISGHHFSGGKSRDGAVSAAPTIAVVLTGEQTDCEAQCSDLLPNTRDCRTPDVPCEIPAGCTLRMQNLTVYGALTVFGTLEMRDCTFIGHFSTEGSGRVQLLHCDVYVDVPETRREGILVLDDSIVELRDNTTLQRKEYTFTDEQASLSVDTTAPFLLQAFVLVSNSGSLRIQGDCHIYPYGTEKTIFAEQDASVDIADSTIMAGFSSAVSILGCRAFLFNTRLYGGDRIDLQVSDINRPTGLNVELGGIVTARHCQAEHLYFGFSVIAHSVAHFYACHADHVVNGYTIDASSVTIANSSARTNHVGVFALNKAKCKISNDTEHIPSFEERCRLLLKLRRRAPRRRLLAQTTMVKHDINLSPPICSGPMATQEPAAAVLDFREDKEMGKESVDPTTAAEIATVFIEKLVEDFEFSTTRIESPSRSVSTPAPAPPVPGTRITQTTRTTTTTTASPLPPASAILPLSFTGGLFSLEVRDATMIAEGMVLSDAQDTSIYVYDQGSLTLTDSVVWTTLTSTLQPCGLKVVNGFAHVHNCLIADYAFGFAAIQSSVVRLEECMAIGGTNGFTLDDAHCTLHHCGADTDHVGVFSLNQSTLRMDNTTAPKYITGGLPCVLKGRVHGLESRSGDTVCVGVIVQRGLDSGFTCYNGGCLRLEKCIVDMGVAACVDSVSAEAPYRAPQSSCAIGFSSSASASGAAVAVAAAAPPPGNAEATGSGGTTTSGGGGAVKAGNNTPSGVSHDGRPPSLPSYSTQKNSGVKAWSGSHCVVVGCEVRHVTFGYAAIGPETELEASHCTAKHIVNGFTVDSAKCRLSRCSTNSNHVGVFVLNHGTCAVRRGSYTARMYSIENRNGIIHVEGHVKLSGFSRIGLYVYDGARLDTLVDSMLDIKVRKDPAQQHLPPQLTLTGASAAPSGLFPSCFAMDKGTAVIHNACFGGGAQCAVSCGDGANVYLHQCTAEFCNVAFNALTGSQMYLSDCRALNVRQHALIVHRGALSRVTSQAPVSSAGSVLQGRLQIDGKCFLEHVAVRPMPVGDKETFPLPPLPPGVTPPSAPFSRSSPFNATLPMPNGLIRVAGCGSLLMDWCLILLEERQRMTLQNDGMDETPTQTVIIVEGRRATVQLRNALFKQVFLSAHYKERSAHASISSYNSALVADISSDLYGSSTEATWYGLALLHGAKGEIRDLPDPTLLGSSASSLCTAAATSEHLAEAPPLENHRPLVSCVGSGADAMANSGITVDRSVPMCNANEIDIFSSGDIVPLRVHVASSSTLIMENAHLRKLVASGGSSIDASHCFFAGPEAVLLSGNTTFRALESVFVGSIRGPAMCAEYATVSLTKCRGYCTHREILTAKCATLTFVDSVLSDLAFGDINNGGNTVSTDLHRLLLGALAEGERGVRAANDPRCGDGSESSSTVAACAERGDTMMPQTLAPTCASLGVDTACKGASALQSLPPAPHANADKTQCDAAQSTLMDEEMVRKKRLIANIRLFSLHNVSLDPSFNEENETIKTFCGIGGPMTRLYYPPKPDFITVTPDGVQGSGCHQSVRLEHSRLYFNKATIIEGGIAADSYSLVEVCHVSRISEFIRAIKEAGVRLGMALLGMKRQ